LLQMPTLKQAQAPRGLAVKWPNDLHHQQHKWGGILIEPLNSHQVVIGVGINVISMQHAVADQAVTDLHALLGQQVNLDHLAAECVHAIDQACQTFDAGSVHLVERFALADSLAGQTIAVERPTQADLIGQADGIDANGALILTTATGQQQVYSGHIRRMD
jgi:BirA family biotin operon repressor/biotin-[acetyl-CoA-carboxylase] ligase